MNNIITQYNNFHMNNIIKLINYNSCFWYILHKKILLHA